MKLCNLKSRANSLVVFFFLVEDRHFVFLSFLKNLQYLYIYQFLFMYIFMFLFCENLLEIFNGNV